MLSIFIPLFCILCGLLFLLEAKCGSSVMTFAAEIGDSPCAGRPRKVTGGEFGGRLLPLQTAALGLPLVFRDAGMGSALLAFSVVCLLYTPLSRRLRRRAEKSMDQTTEGRV